MICIIILFFTGWNLRHLSENITTSFNHTQKMVSVEQALDLIRTHVAPLGKETVHVADSLGHVLAEDVTSPIDMPPFAQSAMDGYALGHGLREHGAVFRVIGEIAAGSDRSFVLGESEAVRIFTGAAVPSTATAIVQQEWTDRAGDTITLTRDVPDRANIRPQGEQIRKDAEALQRDTLITPATVGFLCMLGITGVSVFRRPRVAVLVTGNELVEAGRPLGPGQIYESNSAMLLAVLMLQGIRASVVKLPDDMARTADAVSAALTRHDLLLISGGISVGDHDHVYGALKANGVSEVFYRVQQKPGKPLFFGKKGEDSYVFALPGNPAAALTCHHIYVWEAIQRMAGHPRPGLQRVMLPLGSEGIKGMDRAQFLKARIADGAVHVLEGQSSAMLHTFSVADALVYRPSSASEARKGDPIDTFILPNIR